MAGVQVIVATAISEIQVAMSAAIVILNGFLLLWTISH